jgi:hydrogenase/urease accessory protein HupE
VSGRRRLAGCLTALLAAFAVASAARAHETRPAYLEIQETEPGHFGVRWRTPVLAGMRLPVVLKLPEGVRDDEVPSVQELTDSRVERRVIDAGPKGLAGRRIEFVGLQLTITDVLVRAELRDGTKWTRIARPSQPWVEIGAAGGPLTVLRTYLVHGTLHILFGYDHLLFVLALILIVRSARVLFFTITAFTLAHSLTLALATLGVVHVPGPPVEAAIALSIVLLAVELVHARRGEPGLAARWPWLVAFAFGLLHGFGFASALLDVGLPQGDIPLALFAFNVGVELGQLAFVAVVLALAALARRMGPAARVRERTLRAAPYAIGSLAAFWFFERLARF